MKFKFSLITLGIATVLGLGVGAGLKARKVETAKADASTWMVAVSLNLSEPDSWGATLSELQVHVEGTNLDSWHHMHETGNEHWWTVNIPFTDSQTVTHYSFGFTQTGGANPGWKESTKVETDQTKASHIQHLARTTVGMTWDDSKWVPQNVTGVGTGENLIWSFAKTGQSGVKTPMEEEPTHNRFVIRDLNALTGWDYQVDLDLASLELYSMVKTTNQTLISSHGDTWIEFKNAGVYDVYLTNEYSNGGIFEIKEHSVSNSSYIYYVTNSASATTDYIYSWGGRGQFGGFPGTQITAVSGVQEVTGNGTLRLQGGESSKLIYKIPVLLGGYPGDTTFAFNNGTDSYKSADRALTAGAAYWWTGDANANAGAAIDFLVEAEALRNGAAQFQSHNYSVCGIDPSDAADLYLDYEGLDDDVVPYVTSSTTHTYNGKNGAGEYDWDESYISFANIMAEIYKIALKDSEFAKTHSSNSVSIINNNQNNDTVIIIVVVSGLSLLAMGGFFFIRKRKESK